MSVYFLVEILAFYTFEKKEILSLYVWSSSRLVLCVQLRSVKYIRTMCIVVTTYSCELVHCYRGSVSKGEP